MSNHKLPNLNGSEDELRRSIDYNLKQYFRFFENEFSLISPNDRMTLAKLANQELERRSNEKQVILSKSILEATKSSLKAAESSLNAAESSSRTSQKAYRLSLFAILITLISSISSVFFSFFDFQGDKVWQELQVQKLDGINNNLKEINHLREKLDQAENRIIILEKKYNSKK